MTSSACPSPRRHRPGLPPALLLATAFAAGSAAAQPLPAAPAPAGSLPAAAAAAPGLSPETQAEIARVRAAMADPDPRPPVVVAPADPALYRALGGAAGIDGIVEGMLQRSLSDPRLLPFFGDADLPNLRTQLKAQFCQLSGGPCTYEGANMRKAHAGLDVRAADFNALVEVLQDAMAARGIPFAVQNRFLARLAPFHRDVVNTR